EPATNQPDAGQPALSVSLHDVAAAQPAQAPGRPTASRRRSHVGLLFAVGFTALATGVLVAVLGVGGRPGLRVGDIAAPADTRARSAQGTVKGSSQKPADDGHSSTEHPSNI